MSYDCEPEPDATEKKIRFGCGFLAGAGVAFFCVATALFENPKVALWVLVSGIACGFLAMHGGSSFWAWLAKVFWWF